MQKQLSFYNSKFAMNYSGLDNEKCNAAKKIASL